MATFNASQPYNQINDASGHIYYQQSGSYFSSNQTGAQSLASLPVNSIYNPSQSEALVTVSSNFVRPANTTAYVAGYLVANSTTAGSVVPLSFGITPQGGNGFQVQRVRISKTNTSLTNASFRVHLFEGLPTVTVGDGAAFNASGVLSTSGAISYLGAAAITMGVSGIDGASGQLALAAPIITDPSGSSNIYALVEALAAYTPASGETFTVVIEGVQN